METHTRTTSTDNVSEIGKNLSALERDVIHLQQGFEEDRRDRKVWQQSIESQLTQMSRNLSNAIQEITNRTINEAKPQWQSLAAIATFILALVVLYVSPFNTEMSENKQEILRLRQRDIDSAVDRAIALTKIEALTKSVEQLEEMHQELHALKKEVEGNKEVTNVKDVYLKERLDYTRDIMHQQRLTPGN